MTATRIVERALAFMGDIFYDHDPKSGETDPRIVARETLTDLVERLSKTDRACGVCGKTHAPCACGNPTQCSDDEPGQPHTLCDDCDESLRQPTEGN